MKKPRIPFLPRLRILTVLILVAMLSFAVRVGDFWAGVKAAGTASAQETVKADPPPLPASAATKPVAPVTPQASAVAAAVNATQPSEKLAVPPDAAATADAKGDPAAKPGATVAVGDKKEWRDATDEQYSCSDVQKQLNDDLAKRRGELDKQARELATRQALLQAAKQELDAKVGEMTNLRNEIKGLMGQLSDQEKMRIDSLVKIYEGMKPSDAARIFNTLDKDVLIQVLSQMNERKSSPIIAAMQDDKARAVTLLLAQQKKVPDMDAATAAAAP